MNEAKYSTLFKALKDDILGGKYASGKLLPSENALVRRFGISRSTVQQALRELEKLGFISRSRGRGTFVTKAGACRQIGLIIPGLTYSELYPPLVSDLSHICRANGYTLLLGDVDSPDAGIRAKQALDIVEGFVRQGVSGIIFQPIEFLETSEDVNDRILKVLDAARIPVVQLAYDSALSRRHRRHDVVGINNFEAGRMLGEHLVGIGAKSVHFVLRPRWSPSGAARLHGVAAALADAGNCIWLRRNVLRANPDDAKAVRTYLRTHPRADAFVCGCDEDAMLLQRTLGGMGWRVPEDVLLAGFDDIRFATMMTPALTTVRQPHAQIAAMAFRTLLDRMRDPDLPAREICVSADLVERESTVRMKGKGKLR